VHRCCPSVCLLVCLLVCLSVCLFVTKMQKTLFSQKLSNSELLLWCLLMTCRKSYMVFSWNPLRDPYSPRWLRSTTLKMDMTSFFSAEGGPIWIKFSRLAQNDMSTAVIGSKSKPDVEFQYGGRLGEFRGMSSQSHLPHCRVLPPGEFNVMIPELRVTLQGGRIQRHFISEPRITLQGAVTW